MSDVMLFHVKWITLTCLFSLGEIGLLHASNVEQFVIKVGVFRLHMS